VSQRPLVLVSGLTVGDYLLWNWSLNTNHAAIALISGLTLPPLALATLWLATLFVARLVARTANLRAVRGTRRRKAPGDTRPSAGARALEDAAAQNPPSASSSRKLAA
jgi:hypothetical protein